MSEAKEQKEAVKWFRETYPEHAKALRVSMNGLNFGSGKKAAIMINHIKSQGVVFGEADMAILLPRGEFGCLLIEHKGHDQAHKVSRSQQEYLDYHNEHGNCAVSTRGLCVLKSAISMYMDLGHG